MPQQWFDEDGTPLHECNDCGRLLPDDIELCGKCLRYYDTEYDNEAVPVAY
jgi:hypothetical protein